MKLLILALLVTCLFGCTSIPLSTMAKFATADESDLISLEAEAIRARVTLDQPLKPDHESIALKMEVDDGQRVQILDFPLTLESQTQHTAEDGFFSSRPAKSAFTYKMTTRAVENLKTLQGSFSSKDKSKYSFEISAGIKPHEKPLETITLSLALRLSEQEGFITMLDEAVIDIKQ